MSDHATADRSATPAWYRAETSIHNLTFLIGIGAIIATLIGGSCSTSALLGDLRTEVRDLRTGMRDLRTGMQDLRTEMQDLRTEMQDLRTEMQRQLSAVAVCMLELRNLVVRGDGAAAGEASSACDSVLRAILAPSAAG